MGKHEILRLDDHLHKLVLERVQQELIVGTGRAEVADGLEFSLSRIVSRQMEKNRSIYGLHESCVSHEFIVPDNNPLRIHCLMFKADSDPLTYHVGFGHISPREIAHTLEELNRLYIDGYKTTLSWRKISQVAYIVASRSPIMESRHPEEFGI